MLKPIWKGIAWFFRQDDPVEKTINRKIKHAHISATDTGTTIKVRGFNMDVKDVTPSEIVETYRKMTELSENQERDVIEACKATMLNPLGLTEDHLKHALQCCGFQKTHRLQGQPAYDPRLLQALRLAVSMHSAQVAVQVSNIISNVDNSLEK